MLLLLLILVVEVQTISYGSLEIYTEPNIFIEQNTPIIFAGDPCKGVICKPGLRCVPSSWVESSNAPGAPRAYCACTTGPIYETCPNCTDVMTCNNLNSDLPCQDGCYPPQCVCPPGEVFDDCKGCISRDSCLLSRKEEWQVARACMAPTPVAVIYPVP